MYVYCIVRERVRARTRARAREREREREVLLERCMFRYKSTGALEEAGGRRGDLAGSQVRD